MQVNYLLASLLALSGLDPTGCTLLPYQASDGVKPGYHDMPLPGGCIEKDLTVLSFHHFLAADTAQRKCSSIRISCLVEGV